ncbi:MAG: NAD/NADP octopine/nopaline dehydrogenase family protein [Clostridiales Family XIII bacterium]|jgi:opine dehydrogenase|nr:NAD/NADP octopine/nopaline dehydrogenase family protein [Clostridiales Family XIII bacterium]
MDFENTVAVLGGGNGAHAMAADLCSRGWTVRLYEMPRFKDNIRKVFETQSIEAEGLINGTFRLDRVTDDIEEAVDGAKYIIVITPAYAHKDYAILLKGKVSPGQTIITIPGAFAALVYKKVFGGDPCPMLVDTNDLPYTTRVVAPGRVRIYAPESPGIGVFPSEKGGALLEEIRRIFPVRNLYADVMECGLALVNPALHSGPCILNAGPIEHPPTNFFLYEQGFTPAAAKVDKALDGERRDIAAAFGYDINPFACFATINDADYSWKDLYQGVHGEIGLTPIGGPNDLNSRYLTEDAPCGLVPWSFIGDLVGVETKTIDSIIHLYTVFHERNWWAEGITLEDLGIQGMSADDIKAFCRTGVKA